MIHEKNMTKCGYCSFVADVSPCASQQTHKTKWYVDACGGLNVVSFLQTQFAVKRYFNRVDYVSSAVLNGFNFFF